jgi:heme exporter protein D
VTHLPYIVAAYGLTVLTAVTYGLGAWMRVRRASRRLAAIDPRAAN